MRTPRAPPFIVHHASFFVGVSRDDLAEPADDVVGFDAFGLGVEVGDDAVAEDRGGDLADVLAGDVMPAVQHRAGLGPQHQVLRGPRAGPPGDVFLDEVGNVALALAGEAGELHGVADHVGGYGHLADDLLHPQDVL